MNPNFPRLRAAFLATAMMAVLAEPVYGQETPPAQTPPPQQKGGQDPDTEAPKPPPFTTVRLTNPATDYPAIKPEEAASTGVIHALYDSNNKMKERYPGHFVVVNYIEEAVDPARVPEAGRDELADSQAQTALIKKALEALADRSNKPITYLEVVVGRYDAEGRYTSLYIPALSHALSHGNMLGPNGTDVEYVPGRHDPETPYAEVHVEGRHVYSTAWGQYAATVPPKDRQRAVARDLLAMVNRSNDGYYTEEATKAREAADKDKSKTDKDNDGAEDPPLPGL